MSLENDAFKDHDQTGKETNTHTYMLIYRGKSVELENLSGDVNEVLRTVKALFEIQSSAILYDDPYELWEKIDNMWYPRYGVEHDIPHIMVAPKLREDIKSAHWEEEMRNLGTRVMYTYQAWSDQLKLLKQKTEPEEALKQRTEEIAAKLKEIDTIVSKMAIYHPNIDRTQLDEIFKLRFQSQCKLEYCSLHQNMSIATAKRYSKILVTAIGIHLEKDMSTQQIRDFLEIQPIKLVDSNDTFDTDTES